MGRLPTTGQPDYFQLACDITRSYREALMGQPAAKCKEDASGDWTAYRQVDGLWTIRNRQTGMRVAVDLAEPDALLCAQAHAMREALDKIQVWLMAPAVDKETLKEMYELARRAIEGA